MGGKGEEVSEKALGELGGGEGGWGGAGRGERKSIRAMME